MNIWPLPRVTFRQLSTVRETRPTALITNAAAWSNIKGLIELPLEIQAEPGKLERGFLENLGHRLPTRIEVVYAIGNDNVVNAGKVIASVSGRPLVVVPTAFSSDVPFTWNASIQGRDGFEDIETGAPEEVIINWSIITEANPFERGAGLVEILSSVTALLDWRLANAKNLTTPETRLSQWGMQVAAALSMQAVKAAPQVGQGTAEPLRGLLELLCMSVQLNSVLGHRRATWGSEHIFADCLKTEPHITHAEKVAAGILFALALHKQETGPLRTAMEQASIRLGQIPAAALRGGAERAIEHVQTNKSTPYCILHETDRSGALDALKTTGLLG